MELIDFVLPWVDGNDPQWRANKEAEVIKMGLQNQLCKGDANSECRYRDMDTLRYWFRSVERFAPWVNKVFLITCGQKPEWLEENNPKLVLINHKDYIPLKYLPTFNTRPIDLNLHRIAELSEHFVLFNDDVFLLRPVKPDNFFRNNQPVYPCTLKIHRFYINDNWSKTCFNDYCVVNEIFDSKKSIWENRSKWFNCRALGLRNSLANIIRYRLNKTFSITGYDHLALPHIKSTIQEVWNTTPDLMNESCMCRFRSDNQVNQWLFCTWNLLKGKFFPAKPGSQGLSIKISTSRIDEICEIINKQSVCQVCLNDTNENDDPSFCFDKIRQAFGQILPEKSSFEK